MEVASNTYIIENLAKIFRPIIKKIFIKLDDKNKSYNNIVTIEQKSIKSGGGYKKNHIFILLFPLHKQ